MRTVSRGEIKERALALADAVNDPNIADAWLDQLYNVHVPAVYEYSIECGEGDLYTATMTPFQTEYGRLTYGLPADFHAITSVFVVEDGQRRPLNPVNDRQRHLYRGPTGARTIEIEYIPSCPRFADDFETFDGVSGWDELVSAKLARDVLIKRGADRTVMLDIIAGVEERIARNARKRDRGGPKYVVDVEGYDVIPGVASSFLVGYRLRGANVELYESIVAGAL